MKTLLDAADDARRIVNTTPSTPMWVTEFSWDSAPPDPGGVPMDVLARWTAEAMYRSWLAGVEAFFWLSLRDWPSADLPYSETIQSGLYFRGPTIRRDRPKRTLRAFRFPAVAYATGQGIAYWGRTPNGLPGKVELRYSTRRSSHALAVVRAGPSGVFRGFVRTRLGRFQRGAVIARHRKEVSLPFSLKRVKDFYQPPFGAKSPTDLDGSGQRMARTR